jgi:MerR family transcriptional regulator, light-induced transcriptional regulator
MASILDYADDAKYNIKAVSQKTEIQPVTIRAWERRYNLLTPKRAENGYRLYSDRDVAVLDWVKKQVDDGISISTVVAEFNQAINRQNWPEAVVNDKGPIPSKKNIQDDPVVLTQQLVNALVRLDERMASEIFSDALGNFKLLPLFESILVPTLVEIGSRWEKGEISVAIEHFASNLILGKILGIFQSLPMHASAPKVMVGCAPDELHQIGSLMFAILLRDCGYRVEFLGPDIPLEDLAVYAAEEKPRLLVISATIQQSAEQLIGFGKMLAKLNSKSIFGFAGAAFIYSPDLIAKISGVYLGRTFSESLQKMKDLVPLKNLMKLN